jgi:hypothetical protein
MGREDNEMATMIMTGQRQSDACLKSFGPLQWKAEGSTMVCKNGARALTVLFLASRKAAQQACSASLNTMARQASCL